MGEERCVDFFLPQKILVAARASPEPCLVQAVPISGKEINAFFGTHVLVVGAGPIPKELGKLAALTRLQVNDNALTGENTGSLGVFDVDTSN